MEMATDTTNNQTDTGTTNRTRGADMKHRLENGLLPGLPARHIHKRLNSAPGDEIGSGKFTHPESSAALVANAFGPFMTDSPAMELPALPIGPVDQIESVDAGDAVDPINKDFDWSASSVEVEVECKFPWPGGRHPWLDIRIDQPGAVIGIESKRYEPFRDTSVARFSDAYSQDVWGERMGGYCALRDKMKEGQIEFRHLNAAQLVKHAFGLRTVAHSRAASSGAAPSVPVLVYLYAEPKSWPDGRPIPDADMKRHQGEMDEFAKMVDGDEVRFFTLSYRALLDAWKMSGDGALERHATLVQEEFRPA